MINSIFSFKSYKAYLKSLAQSQPDTFGHGFRSKIAAKLKCQTAYISQVLNKDSDFSAEQAADLSELLNHSKDEAKFFQLLVRRARAGSSKLKVMVDEEIAEILSHRQVLKERVAKTDSLSIENQMRYYSRWYYSAIHILVTVPRYQNDVETMASALNIPRELVIEALNFLISVNLLNFELGKYTPGINRLFLGSDSPMIAQLHTNWRMRAIESMDRNLKSDLHFSTCVSLSESDFQKLKERFIEVINEARAVIKESKEEEVCCLNLDFFSILAKK